MKFCLVSFVHPVDIFHKQTALRIIVTETTAVDTIGIIIAPIKPTDCRSGPMRVPTLVDLKVVDIPGRLEGGDAEGSEVEEVKFFVPYSLSLHSLSVQ